MITITHSFAEGTLVEGMTRGDGTYEILTAHGFRWFRSLATCGVQHSRDRLAKRWAINAAATALREAGHDVEIEIDDDPRPMEGREADRAARMNELADLREDRAARRAAASDAASAEAARLGALMQGEPVKVGHPSERRHRRDLDHVRGLDEKSWDLAKQAQYAATGAQSAAGHMAHREDPHVTARRVERLEAEERRLKRQHDGHRDNRHDGRGEVYTTPAAGAWRERLESQLAELAEQLRYWRGLLARAEADGTYRPVDVTAIRPGDAIKARGRWERVVRVNKATITVDVAPGWDNKVRITNVTEHRSATS